MTSRTLFSKFQRENLRHRLGMILITVFYFLATILSLVINIQNAMYGNDKEEKIYSAIISTVRTNATAVVFTIIIGILMGASGYYYLHSRRKVDFYHSLPIKRKSLFQMIAINSIGIFGALQLVAMVIQTLIIAGTGYYQSEVLAVLAEAYIGYMITFLAAFLVTTLAMILTGNLVVGIMGTGVLMSYSPLLVKGIFDVMGSTFLKTYVTPEALLNKFDYGSPVYLAGYLVGRGNRGVALEEHLPEFAFLVVWVIVLWILCQKLFEMRPSEAAGKAMAFPKTKRPIQILIVIPMAIYTGTYLSLVTMTGTKLWMIFGMILGTFLFHGIIESIYRFDIRGMWANKKQMLATMLVVLGITAIYGADLIGYDSYLPKANEVKMINTNAIQYKLTFGNHIESSEVKGVDGAKKEQLLKIIEENLDHQMDPNEVNSGDMRMTYYMEDGSMKERYYYFSDEVAEKIMHLFLGSETYKKTIAPIYKIPFERTIDVQWSNEEWTQEISFEGEEQQAIMKAYQKDIDELQYMDIRLETSVGNICVIYEDEESGDDMEAYYYVYPTFENTLKAIEEVTK